MDENTKKEVLKYIDDEISKLAIMLRTKHDVTIGIDDNEIYIEFEDGFKGGMELLNHVQDEAKRLADLHKFQELAARFLPDVSKGQ